MMSKRSKVSKNICNEKVFHKPRKQLLAMLQECLELQLVALEAKKEFEKLIKLADAIKQSCLKNKHKNSVKSAAVNVNQEEVRASCSDNHKHRRDSNESISSTDSINDSVLITNKYDKVIVSDEARALLKTNHHNNPDNNRKKRTLSQTTEHKSDSLYNKKAHTFSTSTENSDISGSSSNNKVLVLSNITDHSNKFRSPTTKKVLTLSKVQDHFDKSGSQSNKKVLGLSNTNNHSNKSFSLSKKLDVSSSNKIDHSDKSTGTSKKIALALSNTTYQSDNSAAPRKKMILASSNSKDYSHKSAGPSKEKAVASSNTTDNSDKSTGPSKKKAVASSSITNYSDKSASQSKIMANTIDCSDNSASLSKKKRVTSSNITDHSNEYNESIDGENTIEDNTSQSNEKILTLVATPDGTSDKMALDSSNATEVLDESSDKENKTNDNTSQSNEKIPPPVSAPVAQEEEREDDLVPIGSGRTLVRRDKYNMVNWKSCNTATRTLLRAVFSRAVLSTHSLTGKRSPAFPDRPAKLCLDRQKVTDIILAVRQRFKTKENIIRNIITVKCADEGKMMKTRLMKQEEKENE